MNMIPDRVPHYLPAVRLASRTDSPEISDAFNDIPRASSMWGRAIQSHPRSAHRLSQPLSGLCNPKLRGLVSCRSHPDTLPL